MPQKTSPFLEGKWGWNYGENNWNTGADENWLKFSYMFDRNVDGIVSSLPPAVNGQAYFNTVDNRLYFVVDGTYYSSPCPKWFEVVNRADGIVYRFTGTALEAVESLGPLKEDVLLLDRRISTYDSTLVQAKLFEPVFGFNNGTIDTSVYPGARNATQGMSIIDVAGVPTVFLSQRVSGTSWTTTEMCRLVSFPLYTDGRQVTSFTYSQPINISHGFDITARLVGSDVYIYSSQTVSSGLEGTNAGKGYSRVKWRGSDTSQSDVESFTLFGQEGSGHPLQLYNRSGVCVSDDGKLLILVPAPLSNAARRKVVVYSLPAVEAATDKTQVSPLYLWDLPIAFGQSSNVVQGLACSGTEIAVLLGGTDTFGQNSICLLTIDGQLKREIKFDGATQDYGLSGLLNSTYGSPWRFEPEGITSYRNGFVAMINEGWYASARVVSWEGFNWASIAAADTTGVPPSNGTYWVRTTKPTTDGNWDPLVNYINTSNFNRELKKAFYVGPSLGLSQETSTQVGISDTVDPSAVRSGQGAGATSIGMQWRSVLTVRAWAERLGKYFNAIEYDGSSRFKIFDQRLSSDNGTFSSLQANMTSTEKSLIIRADGTAASTGPLLKLHSSTDPSYPYGIRHFTGSSGSERVSTNQYGNTLFSSDSTYTPITANKPDSGRTISIQRAGVDIGGISQNTAALKVVSAEGLSLRFSSTVSGVETDRWEIDPTSGNFRPLATGTGSLGQPARTILTSYVATRYYTATVFDTASAADPEGTLVAGIGSTHRNTTTGVFKRKTSGTGNTGWVV